MQSIAVLSLIASLLWPLFIPASGYAPVGVIAMLALSGFSILYFCKRTPGKKILYTFVGISILVRIGLLFLYPPSDDIHRYIWEGEIQLENYNPFQLAPDAPELAHLKNENWQGINHKDWPTVYWPTAQLLFKGAAAISPTAPLFKGLFLLFELGTALLLLLLLKKEWFKVVLFWFCNPLVMLMISGEGHLEIVPLFFTVLAYYLYQKKKYGWEFLSLSLAVLAKVNFLLFLPLLINRTNWKKLWLFLPPFLLFGFYLGVNPMAVPMRFGSLSSYNGPLFTLFNIFLAPEITKLLCIGIALVSFAAAFMTAPDRRALLRSFATIFLLCTPTLHSWYLLMATPFLLLSPSIPWMVLHWTILFVMYFFVPVDSPPFWKQLGLMQIVAFTPPVIVMLWQLKRRFFASHGSELSSLSIIMPLYNEERCLSDVVAMVKKEAPDTELILVDGGSTDATKDIAQSLAGVTLLASKEKGRGNQIVRGVEHAHNEVVVILHADTEIVPGTFQRIAKVMAHNKEIIGGSCAMQFTSTALKYRFVSLLNGLRAGLFGISFGDQLQFFRREVLVEEFPDYYLMEDVELAQRMRSKGEFVYLKNGITASTRHWEKRGYIRNFTLVISLLGEFLLKRRFGGISDRCKSFYSRYYG